ncbi:MAG: InlB B-repeat-containing protein, partial [Muribaculaceae bacterium]|nr:InlB B-repeat-containing protein [Muribaculaceae bacterium]
TVSGSFAVNAYKLTYIVDGQEYKSVNVNFGEKITPEEAPEKEGYTFVEWENLPETMPAEDVSVTAIYSANLYKLTVYLDGEIYLEYELKMGDIIEIPEPELPAGTKFNGWDKEIPDTMPAYDLEIHGTTSDTSGLTSIFSDPEMKLTVYSINGRLLLRNVSVMEAREKLSKGMYIINGKKIILK